MDKYQGYKVMKSANKFLLPSLRSVLKSRMLIPDTPMAAAAAPVL